MSGSEWPHAGLAKQARCETANRMIDAIASCGRRFFWHDGNPSRFEVDARGRVWFVDGYSRKRVYTHYAGRWRGFVDGGTLRSLCEALRDYIRTGEPVPAGHFGPWPDWLCRGDLWGYGEDAERVREAARSLGLVREASPAGAVVGAGAGS